MHLKRHVALGAQKHNFYFYLFCLQSPGAPIVIVASHKDMAKDENNLKSICSGLMTRLKEMEIENVQRIRQELQSMQ